jgi:hypothetical protein
MKIKQLLLSLAIILSSANLFAQTFDGADSTSNYLVISTEQQEIALGRYLNANRDIANQCMPGWSVDKANDFFLAFLDNNPQYLRRNLTTSFSAALLEACKKK